MLLILRSADRLKYSQLMDVYLEDNSVNAKRDYPELSAYEGLARSEQDFYGYLKDVFFKTKGAFYAVWTADGIYKAALRMEPYKDGLLLSGVSTAPACRRQGLASALIRQTLEHLEEGVRIYSHVDKNNTASIDLHHRCGFKRCREYAVMLDGSVLHNFCTFSYSK